MSEETFIEKKVTDDIKKDVEEKVGEKLEEGKNENVIKEEIKKEFQEQIKEEVIKMADEEVKNGNIKKEDDKNIIIEKATDDINTQLITMVNTELKKEKEQEMTHKKSGKIKIPRWILIIFAIILFLIIMITIILIPIMLLGLVHLYAYERKKVRLYRERGIFDKGVNWPKILILSPLTPFWIIPYWIKNGFFNFDPKINIE